MGADFATIERIEPIDRGDGLVDITHDEAGLMMLDELWDGATMEGNHIAEPSPSERCAGRPDGQGSRR